MNHYDDPQHTITMTDPPSTAVNWLTRHGARAAYLGTGSDGAGIVFDNGPGTPTHIALPGDTLIHNPNGIITVT